MAPSAVNGFTLRLTEAYAFDEDSIAIVCAHVVPGRPWLEFGVGHGRSMDFFTLFTREEIWGFDTFTGLPEDWCHPDGSVFLEKGHFATAVPNWFGANVHFVKGLFQDTLPAWLEQHGQALGFVHIDCDLYSSAAFVLEQLEPWLDDAVVALDEIRGVDYAVCNKGRAWKEFLQRGTYDAQLLCLQHEYGATFKMKKFHAGDR